MLVDLTYSSRFIFDIFFPIVKQSSSLFVDCQTKSLIGFVSRVRPYPARSSCDILISVRRCPNLMAPLMVPPDKGCHKGAIRGAIRA
jgi:hypothetical protein